MSSTLKQAIGSGLASFLSRPLPGYRRLDTISIEKVAAVMQAGDILLVEGNSRISSAIKYLTQSSWSHAALYFAEPGTDPGDNCLIEADLREGVRVVSMNEYRDSNLRICRPVGLEAEAIAKLLRFAHSKVGHQYDLKNIWDLVRYLIQKPMVPTRYRRAMLGLGSGEPTRAICSTLVAQCFQQVDYPILPHQEINNDKLEIGEEGEVPLYYKRHFTHFVPRDFDLSPYFKIIKPTLEAGFDYRALGLLDRTLPDRGATDATPS